MLTLMKPASAWGMRNASPLNLKAEALLAMSGLPYETREAMPSKGPLGKLPALVDGSRVIGDSARMRRPGTERSIGTRHGRSRTTCRRSRSACSVTGRFRASLGVFAQRLGWEDTLFCKLSIGARRAPCCRAKPA